jgi:superfamily II DNA or RNA helicase
MQLRPYQTQLVDSIRTAWQNGDRNVCAVMPTGAGKTVVLSNVMHYTPGISVAIAHRQELVGQISQALAREGLKHEIIAPRNVIKNCVENHVEEFGKSYFDPNGVNKVAGVDTIIRRDLPWANNVKLWVMDETHHVLTANKWGKAVAMFPGAVGLGVTATPERADGFGLSRESDGVFDNMVEGPNMRYLIDNGFLTDYRIFAPRTSDLNLDQVELGSNGDYKPPQLSKAIKNSHVIGDVVRHYLKIAPGKRGVTFAPDIETATEIANNFNAAGVPAAVVHGGTPDRDRTALVKKLRNGQLLQLVNVDLFGEGFDLPAIEVVSFARPTMSYGLYVQQFGRVLRILEGKTVAIIIDHVGNVIKHGLPDAPRVWSLDRREKRSTNRDEGEALKACDECTRVYERFRVECPYCGHIPTPAQRSGPEFVDGDLIELDASVLAQMRGQIEKVDGEFYAPNGLPKPAQLAARKNHIIRQESQKLLRESIAMWAGVERANGLSDREIYKKFYLKYGVDIMTAQTLGRNDATKLTNKVLGL